MPFVQGTEVTPTSSLSYKKPPCCILCDHFRDTTLKVSTAAPHRVLFKPSVREQQPIRGWWP